MISLYAQNGLTINQKSYIFNFPSRADLNKNAYLYVKPYGR